MDTVTFVKNLLRTPRGQSVLCNLLHGYDSKFISRADCQSFLDVWRELHNTLASGSSLNSPFDVLVLLPFAPSVRHKLYPGVPAVGKDLRIRCKKPLGSGSRTTGVTTTMSLTTFLRELADSETQAALNASGLLDFRETNISYSPQREEPSAVEGKLRSGKTLGQEGGLVWITDTRAVADALVKGDGDGIRDVVGLIHHLAGIRLVALSFASDVLSGITSGRPTALDAGANRCFKSATESRQNQRCASWGYTSDLAKFVDGSGCIDGAPERVCYPIPSEALGTIRINPLKPTSQARGQPEAEFDKVFVKRINLGRGSAQLRTAVLALL